MHDYSYYVFKIFVILSAFDCQSTVFNTYKFQQNVRLQLITVITYSYRNVE